MAVKIKHNGSWVDVSGGSTSGTTKVALLKDQKNNAVEGGSFNNGAWRDRDLTVIEDPQSFVTFVPTTNGETTASPGNTPGYWSLPAGIYKIEWSAPAAKVNRHKTRLVYSTVESQISSAGIHGSASYIEGGNANLPGTLGTYLVTESSGSDIITITQTTWFKIVHWGTESLASTGFGKAMDDDTGSGGSGPNIYTQIRIEDLATAVKKTGDDYVAGVSKVAVLEEQQTSGTVGGTFTSGAWQNRTLNTETDPKSFVSLDSGNVYFSLAAGTYEIGWSAPAHAVDQHQTRLIYATDTGFSSGVGYVYGSSECTSDPMYEDNIVVQTRSFGSTTLTITGTTYFKIQHRCTDTSANNMGFGVPSNYSGDSQVEVYTQVFVEDLATAVKKTGDDYVAGVTKVATVKDVKAYNERGGAFAASEWVHRTLNTLSDPKNIGLSISGNVVTVPAGTYRMRWRAPAYGCDRFTSRLAYSTTSSTVASGITYVDGTTSYDATGDGAGLSQIESFGDIASITFASTTYLKIEQYSAVGRTPDPSGLGVDSNISDDGDGNPVDSVYTTLEIEDLATAVKKTSLSDAQTKIATLQHQETQNTDAGAFIAGAWHLRELTTKNDPQNFVTFPVSSDSDPYQDWSLPVGSYKIRWSAPGYRVNAHQTRLVYATDSSFTSPTYVMGSSEESPAVADESQTSSFGETILTLTAAKTWFRVEHRCGTTNSTNGQGHASNFATEVYTQVSIEDLATSVKQPSFGVWHVQKTGTQTIDNETWTDITDLSQTVTASNASSKFLITATVNCGMSADTHDGLLRLMRGTTVIGSTSSDSSATTNTTGFGQVGGQTGYYNAEPLSITYLDTPGAGTHTYHIEGLNHNNASNLLVNTRGVGTFYTTSHMSIQQIS